MYLPSGSPIPVANGACKGAASDRRLAKLQCQINKGRMNLYATTPSVASLATISPELAADAATILDQSQTGRASVVGAGTPTASALQSSATVADVIRQSPSVVPLNPGAADMNACGAVPLVQAKPIPSFPVMPKAGPVITAAGLRTPPVPTNLCWALRNGAVDASQFDPAELMQLQYTCSQKGYTGACPPPQWVLDYLNANRGSLPHIPVSQAILDAIPQAPDMTGVKCADSYKLAGLAGVAPDWGDAALSFDGGYPAQSDGTFLGWVKAHPLMSLGVAAGLVFLVTDERRKGRRGY